jgi:UDP-N-acetylglucosamine 2-epimerase (hydrolysing)
MTRSLLFLTGTRADFGKLKPLMRVVEDSPDYDLRIFVTGMHALARYGNTHIEVERAGFRDLHLFMNQYLGEPMELVLANTIGGLSRYVHADPPDLIVVHGDRIETLAGAIVGALTNVLVAHVEGGERSGTVDELIRHAVSKLSHLHFVANDEAAERLQQLGESPESIYVVGSPDIDVMLSSELPTLDRVQERYEIDFDDYAIALFHSVTTELDDLWRHANDFVAALRDSDRNYVVIYPNNDEGSQHVFDAYRRLERDPRFRIFPSLRFEYFLSLLQHSRFIIGNSSAGIREAPVFGVPTINVGTRQHGRFHHDSIVHVGYDRAAIVAAIEEVDRMPPPKRSLHFGRGDTAARFLAALERPELWATPRQKQFYDLPFGFGGTGRG